MSNKLPGNVGAVGPRTPIGLSTVFHTWLHTGITWEAVTATDAESHSQGIWIALVYYENWVLRFLMSPR